MAEMIEPELAQLEEMYSALQIAVGSGWTVRPNATEYLLTPAEVLRLIAHVRKQARDDALERAMRYFSDTYDEPELLRPSHIISRLQKLKDQPTGEPQ